jgi:hypothetical protein
MEKTMISENKMEANRRNAQKSTGPNSAAGKERSRFNALKHGMRANLLVLPGEDADAFAARVDAWTDDLKPRNEAEQYLVDLAARVSWQLDRVERAHVARLTANINNTVADAALGMNQPEEDNENALMLGARLFWDARGPINLYPHSRQDSYRPGPMVSFSGNVDDPDNPARIVLSLESTAKGVDWLLDRWAELRSILERGQAWQSPDKLKAIRLLGRQPLDALDDPKVSIVFLACHKIDPSGGEVFHEVWKELPDFQIPLAKQRLVGRPLDSLEPRTGSAARQALFDIVDRAVGQLQLRAETHRQRAEANAKMMPAVLAFDDSNEGERLRRYEASCSRILFRTLDAFAKMRKAKDKPEPVEPAGSNGFSPVTTVETESERNVVSSIAAACSDGAIIATVPVAPTAISDSATLADLVTQSSTEPAAICTNQDLPNEPTEATGADHQDLPNEPTAATGADHQDLPSEPTSATGADHQDLPNEPTAVIGAGHQDLPNEPAAGTFRHQGRGPKNKIETKTNAGNWRGKPKPGIYSRERRAQPKKGLKLESDLAWTLPPNNPFIRKPLA